MVKKSDSVAESLDSNRKLFGTDGVRGVANLEPVTAETALKLGRAAAHVFTEAGRFTHRMDRRQAVRDRVPLVARSIELLKSARKMSPLSELIFVGSDVEKSLSNGVFLQVMARGNYPFTPHGFRSSFRDWAGETTTHPRDVCEMALAHTIKDKTEAAYRRGDLFERRRALMTDWADYITKA